jgi:hypothetical protein
MIFALLNVSYASPADSEIILPDGSIRNVQKGEYRFESIYRVD